jgi:predicted metal-dependent phosphoesterase TrpH
LAHPGEWVSRGSIEAMRDFGLDAIEVVHPSHDQRLTDYYYCLAAEKGMLRTGGSDLHAISPETPGALGTYRVTSADVDALRRCARKRAQ